ncbi:hypothetical protein JL720_3965 [Aureococcus anophagefferens]|nr:hypothetical protein JL720_3965 [Aureococcus anophagefferens]
MEDCDDDDDDDMMLGGEATDDFRERTAWQSKHETKTCFGCGGAFNLVTNRHHHCRQCGRVVCGQCSPWKDAVKGYASPQRTCNACHEDIAAGTGVQQASRALFALCPCFRWARREFVRSSSVHARRGAVFVKKTSRRTSSRPRRRPSPAPWEPLRAQGRGARCGAAPSLATSRCKVRLRPDGASLSLAAVNGDDEDVLYLHDVRAVEARANNGLALVGAEDRVLFEGNLVERRTRDAWVAALKDVVRDAASKPPPSRSDRRPASRVETAARRAKREIELQGRKRDAEKRKGEYMEGVGGGLKYTALAMANRASTDGAGVV